MKVFCTVLAFLFIVGQASTVFAEKPGWTTYKSDGSIKGRTESEFKDGKIIKTDVYDASGQLEFIEYPIYDASGKISGKKRHAPDGKPWPYDFPVYGAASLGGVSKIQKDIKKIESLLTEIGSKYPILEVVFLKDDRVEVQTGVVRGPLDGMGIYYDFEKKDGIWLQLNKDTFRSWVS